MRRKGFSFSLMLSAGILLFGVSTSLTSCGQAQAVQIATVRLNKSSLNLSVGEDATLSVQVSKQYKDAPVYWVSTNENVAMVKDGHVIALGLGQCEVQVHIGGGRAVCAVTVGEGGGSGETDPYLRISPINKTVAKGNSFKITYTAYPTGSATFTSGDNNIAVVGTDGTVQAINVGSTNITVSYTYEGGATPLTKQCAVTVTESGGGGSSTDYDIGTTETNMSGSFVIGSPVVYKDMTINLLKDFNKYTNSNITWEIKDFEENTAATNLTPDASLGPDVFPYASDQTQSLNTLNALARLGKNDKNWIKTEMGDAALAAATLGSIGTVGYPFASDNSYVMFYDKSKIDDPSKIDTVSKLFAEAAKLDGGRGRPFKVSYNLADGFYGAAALMSFSGGESMYEYIPLADGSYKSKSHFSDTSGTFANKGLQGARELVNIFRNNSGTLDSTYSIPSDSTKTLATISDCSKVLGMKQTMGDNYAVAPLPFLDDAKTTRLSSFSGYKFYGVNNKKLGNDTAKKAVAEAIAKFMVSEYAQHVRLETFGIKPTNVRLQDKATEQEAHVRALNEQATSHAAISLSVVDSTFWAQTGNAVTDIKTAAQAGEVSDDTLKSILAGLDAALLHNYD